MPGFMGEYHVEKEAGGRMKRNKPKIGAIIGEKHEEGTSIGTLFAIIYVLFPYLLRQ